MTDNDFSRFDKPMDLTGRILIAMPGMDDPRFGQSVVFICAHSDDGAMGLILNKPADDLNLFDLMEQLDITRTPAAQPRPVHFGGPVETGRGFVLHEAAYRPSLPSLKVVGGFALTATLDILEDMAIGQGPQSAIVALGYAGWGPGQLEDELAQNGWLVCDANHSLVFATAATQKWEAALASMGISPLTLSAEAGHA
ncbi:YqgE/AlgH family protein [Rhodobacteraceae bacterium KMM 6894]|nr:YqgE/AlgH family protein [Rhodobacteraceae bacterium KMM 6894]